MDDKLARYNGNTTHRYRRVKIRRQIELAYSYVEKIDNIQRQVRLMNAGHYPIMVDLLNNIRLDLINLDDHITDIVEFLRPTADATAAERAKAADSPKPPCQ